MKDARDLGEQVDLIDLIELFPADTEINRAQFPERYRLYFWKSETSSQLNELQSIVPPDRSCYSTGSPDRLNRTG